jgi:hypothetical protein
MGATFAIQNATLVTKMPFLIREFHASAISKTSRTACGGNLGNLGETWGQTGRFLKPGDRRDVF